MFILQSCIRVPIGLSDRHARFLCKSQEQKDREMNYLINQETNASNERQVSGTNESNLNQVNATNAANLLIARETNAENYRQFKEQMENDWKMWNATNEYNSPEAMRARYEAAGINPALAMQGSASAQMAHLGHSASPIPAQAATMQAGHSEPFQAEPYYVDPATSIARSEAITHSASAFVDSLFKASQMYDQNINNMVAREKSLLQLEGMKHANNKALEEANISREERRSRELNNYVLERTKDANINKINFDAKNAYLYGLATEEQIENYRANRSYQAFQMQMQKKNFELSYDQAMSAIKEINARIDLMSHQKNLTDAQAENAAAAATETVLRSYGIKLDNDTKEAIGKELIAQQRWMTAALEQENEIRGLDVDRARNVRESREASNFFRRLDTYFSSDGQISLPLRVGVK